MPMERLMIDALQCFVAVVDCGSLSRAGSATGDRRVVGIA
jgi:hypothetical protein